MAERVVNGFMKGMTKDLNYSLLDNQQYIHAENIRPVSSGFNSTGAIENIRGNKFIGDNAFLNTEALVDGHTYIVAQTPVVYAAVSYPLYSSFICSTANGLTFDGGINSLGRVLDITNYEISIDQNIIGGVEIRDNLVLFTTNNTKSQIYRLTLTGVSNSTINTLELLYDDTLNIDSSTLNFNINYPIKAIARYETPNIQKVYWTDGINPLRYINITRPATITGEVYSNNDYWGVDKFELLPEVLLTKPTITGITNGTISTGMVFYAYQLYLENGAESAMSYISDPLHVVADSDYYTSDLNYEGDGVNSIKSKGFIVNIDFTGNDSYDRLKLIRIHYESYNQTPKIYIASDIPIDIINNTNITITDVGSVIGELTTDEFNISSSEIFVCQELATKNNILFAGNIEKKKFEIDSFDARAVRFRNYADTPGIGITGYSKSAIDDDSPEDSSIDGISALLTGPKQMQITIENFTTWANIESGRTVIDVNNVVFDRINLEYTILPNTYSTLSNIDSITDIVYTALTDTLVFDINSTDVLAPLGVPDTLDWLGIYNSTGFSINSIEYEYDTAGETVLEARPWDSSIGETRITVPSTDTLVDWNNAGWINYTETQDGINFYNNPDNDFNISTSYKFQSDGFTLGAEGPNITIGFDYEDFSIDDVATTASTFYVGLEPDGSYKNYSSPLNGGKLTWQRDEVYRLFMVFKNTRGQDTEPKWICDLRIPAMTGSTYGVLTSTTGSTTSARRIYPTIKIKDGAWPIDAVSAQVYRVPRNREDRQVVSQCLAYPFQYTDSEWHLYSATANLNDYSSDNENIVKLVSPEINITKNISKAGTDYLEYLTTFGDAEITEGGLTEIPHRYIVKCTENTVKSSLATNDRTDIVDSISVIPIDNPTSTYTVGGISFYNYKEVLWAEAKGSTGLVVKYSNNDWTAEGNNLALVNYKNNCWNSQYGGLTFENRQFNSMLPCSDILYTDNVLYNCEYGDTFINYFDVSTLLYDLTIVENSGSNNSKNESVYVPLESSINCNLRSSGYETHKIANATNSFMVQEELGAHMFTDSGNTLWAYNQTDDMYKYNTVYSQQPLVAAKVSIDTSRAEETVFDTQVKASNVKINGEFIDSWTKFGVNETIEVDSLYGSLNAMLEYGHSLYFWQDKAFGILSVNDRSLIQDNNTSKLVLGTGGILDRYDYISTQKGCEDKFSVVGGVAGLYWIDRRNLSINRFAESLLDLTLQKSVKSVFTLDEDIINWPKYISVQDKANNEILFTVANYTNGTITNPGLLETSLNRPFTLCFNETMDAFTTEYTFKPYIYIPFKNTFLSATFHNPLTPITYPANLLFIHEVDNNIQSRNNFYGLYYNDVFGKNISKIRTVFNPHYLNTKTFDNMFFNGEIKLSNIAIDTYRKDVQETIANEYCPINTVLFYNDYQTTGDITLEYKTNLERRERTWTTIIPRNTIQNNYDAQAFPPIIDPALTRIDYQERMRDKYIVCEVTMSTPLGVAYSYRTILENLGVTYRNSYR